MSTFDLAARLSAVLKNEINNHALELSARSAGRCRRLIKSGAERMAAANVSRNQVLVYLAENNIRHLVGYLARKALGKGSWPNIGDNTLETALTECTPMWPYRQNGK